MLCIKKINWSWAQVDHLVILATWEAEMERIAVQGQPWQVVLKTPSPK
jgi:hypothetical protein